MLQGSTDALVLEEIEDDVEVADNVDEVNVIVVLSIGWRLMRNQGDNLYCQSLALLGLPKVRNALASNLYSPLGIFSPLFAKTP